MPKPVGVVANSDPQSVRGFSPGLTASSPARVVVRCRSNHAQIAVVSPGIGYSQATQNLR